MANDTYWFSLSEGFEPHGFTAEVRGASVEEAADNAVKRWPLLAGFPAQIVNYRTGERRDIELGSRPLPEADCEHWAAVGIDDDRRVYAVGATRQGAEYGAMIEIGGSVDSYLLDGPAAGYPPIETARITLDFMLAYWRAKDEVDPDEVGINVPWVMVDIGGGQQRIDIVR